MEWNLSDLLPSFNAWMSFKLSSHRCVIVENIESGNIVLYASHILEMIFHVFHSHIFRLHFCISCLPLRVWECAFRWFLGWFTGKLRTYSARWEGYKLREWEEKGEAKNNIVREKMCIQNGWWCLVWTILETHIGFTLSRLLLFRLCHVYQQLMLFIILFYYASFFIGRCFFMTLLLSHISQQTKDKYAEK